MAFLVSGRDEEEVKLRAFPLVLREEAKVWFQGLERRKKGDWGTLREVFMGRFGGGCSPEEIWRKLSSLQQISPLSYLEYEAQFLKLWAEWENTLEQGERAPNFLQKERFLDGLSSPLKEKVKGKFPRTFEEAMQLAQLKDRKLQFQAYLSRTDQPQPKVQNVADEVPTQVPTTLEDPHLELLQRVTNQLDNLSINMVQGAQRQQHQPPNGERGPNDQRQQRQRQQRRDYFCYNCGEDGYVSSVVLAKVLDYTLYHGKRLCAITAAAIGNGSSGFNEKNAATTAAITAEADSDTQLAVDVAAKENIAGAAEEPAEEESTVADCNAPDDDVVAGACSSDSPAPARRTPEDADKQWDLQFLKSLASEKKLFDVMMAAHYLNIPGLQHLTCVRAGERMRGMTPEQARTLFNLPSDFTPEEDAAIRRQNEWAFSRK
ncbi:hypothetical protein L7F22_028684 [Adiantum nelumboides]|nr:hypothetical protein [Adiantum nelumboides]